MIENKEFCNTTGKVCYSQKEAGIILNDFKRFRNRNKRKSIPQRYYKCQFCGYWHLTHFRNLKTCKVTLRRCGHRGHKEILFD